MYNKYNCMAGIVCKLTRNQTKQVTWSAEVMGIMISHSICSGSTAN